MRYLPKVRNAGCIKVRVDFFSKTSGFNPSRGPGCGLHRSRNDRQESGLPQDGDMLTVGVHILVQEQPPPSARFRSLTRHFLDRAATPPGQADRYTHLTPRVWKGGVPGDGLLDIRGCPTLLSQEGRLFATFYGEQAGWFPRGAFRLLQHPQGVGPCSNACLMASSTPSRFSRTRRFSNRRILTLNRARKRSRAASLSLPEIVLCPAPSSSTPRRHSVQ